MDGRRNFIISAFLLILPLLIYSSTVSADILEWIGPNGTASPWETGINWYSLDTHDYRVPTNIDTARLYNELGLGFTDSDVTVSSTTAICQKLQMKWRITKLTILTGGRLTTTGSVEMYQGQSSRLDIQVGAVMDACTKTNTDSATFRLSSGSAAAGADTVNVYGILNIVSQVPTNGISLLDITNNSSASGTNTGTLNIYSTGVVNVDAYIIGSYGTGRIYIYEGGVMTIAGDATGQVNADIVAGKIAGVGTNVAASYNSSEGKTYVTAGEEIPDPPEAPASISYPTGSSTGSYTVSWSASNSAISYQLERSNNGGSNWSQVYAGDNLFYSENVTDGNYRYRIRAGNSGGSSGWTTGTWDCVVALAEPPLPPSSITYPAGSNSGQYTVSWALSSGASSYQLERSSNSGGNWEQVYSGANTSYSESITNGSYRYRIRASNAGGSSNWTTGTFDCVVSIPEVAMYFSAGTAAGWNFHDIQANISGGDNVDWNDLSILAQHWLNSGCDAGNNWCGKADINAGGNVDFVDYAMLANNWGKKAGDNILLQTIYGTAQDSSGNITANTTRVLQFSKGLAMAFKVPADTTLDKAIFKCVTGVPPGWRAGQILHVHLYNVTGRGYLNYNHTGVTRANPGGIGNPAIFAYSLTTPDSVPYHSELGDGKQYADLVIDFGGLPITAGEYFITFDREELPPPNSSSWGSFVCSYQIDPPPPMGKYPDGSPLPKGATVTTSSEEGNTYYYALYDSYVATYDAYSYLFAFQIMTLSNP